MCLILKLLVDSMVGDTNLFFSNESDRMVAEAEIMIAEEDARGKHYGLQAMLLMFWYGITYLNVQQFVVKILLNNTVSIKMFEKIGFVETSRSSVFNEITLNKVVDNDWITWLKVKVGQFEIINTE